MRNWRIWIITMLILALPVASMATISNIHCMSNTESTTVLIDLSSTDHCDNSGLNAVKDSSLPTECSCDCNDTLGCLNSSTSGFALTTYIKSSISFSNSQLNIDLIDQLISFHSPPLIRPPIS